MRLQNINEYQPGRYLTDKGKDHNYLMVYDTLFYTMKDLPINIFEVGYYGGGSCLLWERYFKKAKVRSVDINPLCMDYYNAIKHERVRLDIMDINDITDEYFEDFPIDIAIDDGSHEVKDQVNFVKKVYPHLKEGGIMIIEDIQDIRESKPEFDKLGIEYKVVDLSFRWSKDNVLLIFRK